MTVREQSDPEGPADPPGGLGPVAPVGSGASAGSGASVGSGGPVGPELGCRRLRTDAARNRAVIVSVARDVFAEQGLEAPLEAIAVRAGVGIATLYRRFPTREKLVAGRARG